MSSVLAGLDGCHWIAAYDSRHSANRDAAVDARRNGASDGAAEGPADTLPGDGCNEDCEIELAITSHANETDVVHFEERFTGVCDSDRPLTATPGPRVTLIDSSCVGNVLELLVGFQSVDGGAEDRTFTLEDGVSTHKFTVRFKLECPENYSGVAGDTEMGTTDFCVANYEMKKEVSGDIDPDGNTGPTGWECTGAWNASWRAVSSPKGWPWMCITPQRARMSCGNNDDGTFSYRLITNAQWQTLARNIESWPANWTDAGVLKQGYNGGTCASDDPDACYPGSGLPTDRISDTNPKAMYVLRSGGQVWDVSGNIWDIVDLDGLGGGVTYTNPSGEGWYELDSVESLGIYGGSAEVSAADFLPRDTYPNLLSETGIGMIYYWEGTNVDMTILRGGNHWENARVGPFMASITQNYLGPTGMVGFRCSCSPAIR